MKWRNIGWVFLWLWSCSSIDSERHLIRVGIDPSWHEVDLYGQEAHMNGFIEDLLIEVAQYSGLKFERIQANWDALFSNLLTGQYDVIVSALEPRLLHQETLAFSELLLPMGPVLVVPFASPVSDLTQLAGKIVGFQSREAQRVLQQDPQLIVRGYDTPAVLLQAVAHGEIDGALLDPLLAAQYVSNLFAQQLRVIKVPLTQEGMRFVFGQNGEDTPYLRTTLNRSVEHLRRQGKLEALMKKWQLSTDH